MFRRTKQHSTGITGIMNFFFLKTHLPLQKKEKIPFFISKKNQKNPSDSTSFNWKRQGCLRTFFFASKMTESPRRETLSEGIPWWFRLWRSFAPPSPRRQPFPKGTKRPSASGSAGKPGPFFEKPLHIHEKGAWFVKSNATEVEPAPDRPRPECAIRGTFVACC